MSAELSILVTRLKKEAASVAGSGRTHAPAVAEVLHRRFKPAEGQPETDFLALQLALVRMVDDGLQEIDSHDESLVLDLDEDREQLAERVSAFEEATDVLGAVQSACDGVYGVKASRKLFGNVETLPRDPVQVVKLGRRVQRRLADPEYPLPAPRLKGWPPAERRTLAAELGDAIDRLDRALDSLTSERKSSENTRFFKAGAVDGFRRTLRYAAGCLGSLYGLAGFDDLADKIRPRRRRRAAEDPGEAGAAEPPASEPASEPAQDGDDATPEPPVGPTLVVG